MRMGMRLVSGAKVLGGRTVRGGAKLRKRKSLICVRFYSIHRVNPHG